MIKHIALFCWIVFSFLSSSIWSQFDVSFSIVAQKNQVNFGESVQVSIRLTFPGAISIDSVQFPEITEVKALNDTIEILSFNPSNGELTKDSKGKSVYVWQQDFQIALFAGGNISIPAFKAIVNRDTVATNILVFSVEAPEVNMEEGIKGMKDIAEDPFTFWEHIWLFITNNILWIIIVLALIVAWIIYKRITRKDVVKDELLESKIPLLEQLLMQLDTINNKELWQHDKHKEYYTEVTAVIRKYLEHKYEISTFEKTSFEILDQLKLSAINKNDFQQLSNLFDLSDMIKFAKSLPSPQDNIMAMQIAKKLIVRAIEVRDKKQSKTVVKND